MSDCAVQADERTGNRLLDILAPDELTELRPQLERVSFGLGDLLIAPGQRISSVYFPVTLLGSLVTVLEDGSTVEAGSAGREGLVGIPAILGAETTPMQTLVQIAGDAWRLKADTARALFEKGGSFRHVVSRYVHTIFIVASQSAACNRKHSVEARLARWLLMSSDGIGSDDVGITQEFLATMLGVRRPGVTEAAVKLQDDGLIRYSRGHVRITDRPGLEDAACECYQVVKQEFERLFA